MSSSNAAAAAAAEAPDPEATAVESAVPAINTTTTTTTTTPHNNKHYYSTATETTERVQSTMDGIRLHHSSVPRELLFCQQCSQHLARERMGLLHVCGHFHLLRVGNYTGVGQVSMHFGIQLHKGMRWKGGRKCASTLCVIVDSWVRKQMHGHVDVVV